MSSASQGCCFTFLGKGRNQGFLSDDADETTPLVEERNGERSVLIYAGLPAICTYLCGVLFLMHAENWPFVTASYVVAQMVTTVGYGEFTVTSESSKIFIGFYVFLVVIIMAYSYNLLASKMVDWEVDMLRGHLRKLEMYEGGAHSDAEAAEKYGATNKVIATAFMFSQALLFGIVFFGLYENCACSYGLQKTEGCDDTDVKSCIATGGYVKTWTDCFYMCSVTLATIGFGDFQPRSYHGRIFGIIWMLLGVVATASFLSALSSYLFEVDKRMAFNQTDAVLSISEQSFRDIDRNNDGSLSRGEYLAFTLKRYGLISEELIEEIQQQYEALDVKKNNKVSWEAIQKKQRDVCKGMQKHRTLDQLIPLGFKRSE